VNALHRALLGRRRTLRAEIRGARAALVTRSLAEGPQALSERDRRVLLHDPDAVDALHERVWALDDPMAVARWGRPAGKGAEPAA
jgi:membrane glycosyltransferase